MNLKVLAFLSLCILLSFESFAQEDYRSGFIVTLEKDTIQGLVAYRSLLKNYESCLFKNGQGEKEYGPKDILGYGFAEDKYYVSQVEEGFFSQVLVSGAMSLYTGLNKYFIQKDTILRELESNKELIKKDGKVGMAERSRWRGIVNYLVGDCLNPEQTNLNNLRLSDVSLTRLVVKYNECVNADYLEYGSDKQWVAMNFGLLIGLSRSQLQPDDRSLESASDYEYLAETYNSYHPNFGLVFELTSPRVTEALAFQAELQFFRSKFAEFVTVNGNPVRNYDTFIELSTLAVPLSIKYNFGSKPLNWFVQLGISFEQHLDTRSRLLSDTVRNGVVTTNPEDEAFLIKNSQLGYWGGFGAMKSFESFRAGLSIRGFLLNPLDQNSLLDVNSNRISLNLTVLTK